MPVANLNAYYRDGKTDCNPMFILLGKEQFLSYHYWSMDYALDQMFCESAQRFYGASKKEKTVTMDGEEPYGMLRPYYIIPLKRILYV